MVSANAYFYRKHRNKFGGVLSIRLIGALVLPESSIGYGEDVRLGQLVSQRLRTRVPGAAPATSCFPYVLRRNKRSGEEMPQACCACCSALPIQDSMFTKQLRGFWEGSSSLAPHFIPPPFSLSLGIFLLVRL